MKVGKLLKKLSMLTLACSVAWPLSGAFLNGHDSEAWAQRAGQKREEEKKDTRKSFVITNEKVAKILGDANTLITDQNNFQGALDLLRTAPAMDKLASYDRAKLNQMLGMVYANMGNYKESVKYFEAMLKEEELSEQERSQATYILAQLFMATDQTAKGVALLENWFKTAQNPGPDAHFLLCQGYLGLEDFKKALTPCLATIRVAEERGQELKENWYRAVIVVYQQNQDLNNTGIWLKRALDAFPNRDYWIQLVSVLNQQNKEMEEFAAYRSAYQQDLLRTENEYLRMATLFQYHGMPHQGAMVLIKAFKDKKVEETRKNLELLANSLTLARDYDDAINPLAKAANIANEGPLWERLAQVYIQDEEWAKAADALQKAIKAGGLRDPYRTRILEGMTLVNGGKYDEALAAFNGARRFAETDRERRDVDSWVRVTEEERRRAANIREYNVKRYASR